MEAGVNIKPISSTIANDFALPPMEDFERLITPRTKAIDVYKRQVKGCGKPVYMRCGTPIPSSAIAEAITRATVSESVRRIVCFCASASRRIGKSW